MKKSYRVKTILSKAELYHFLFKLKILVNLKSDFPSWLNNISKMLYVKHLLIKIILSIPYNCICSVMVSVLALSAVD